MRRLIFVLPSFLGLPLLAQVKVAGVEFLPKNVIFPSSDERTRAMAEGPLSEGCKWVLRTETRVGQGNDAKDCVVYYYRTTVSLAKSCSSAGSTAQRSEAPAALVPTATSSSERTTIAGRSCPTSPFTPVVDTKILSVGKNSDGKRQEIVVQPDGTRVVVLTEATGVIVQIAYPDGTADVLTYK